jgi:peptidoglycan/LPS O-acetylase OafA/YrhL
MSEGRKRYESLDFFRAIACLGVIIAHSCEIHFLKSSQLFVFTFWDRLVSALVNFRAGVQIFFCISGYCITYALFNKRTGFKGFFFNRFKRIFPPYWACFFIFAALTFFAKWLSKAIFNIDSLLNTADPSVLDRSQWIGNLLLWETWRYHVFGSPKDLFLSHAWSLCYEEQFYLFLGIFLFISRRFFFQLMCWFSLVVFLGVFFQYQGRVDFTGFGFDRYWIPFGFGILVFYYLHQATLTSRKVIFGLVTLVSLIAIFLHFTSWSANDIAEGVMRSVATAGTFSCVLFVLHSFDKRFVQLPVIRQLTFVGTFSYSLYLVHLPITFVLMRLCWNLGLRDGWQAIWISTPLCIFVSLLAAWPFYLLFEKPFLSRSAAKP